MRDLIRKSKRAQWEQCVETLDTDSDVSQVCRVMQRLEGTSRADRGVALEHHDQLVFSDFGMSQAFMWENAAVSRYRLRPDERNVKRKVGHWLRRDTVDDE